jgi:hypothetical protein
MRYINVSYEEKVFRLLTKTKTMPKSRMPPIGCERAGKPLRQRCNTSSNARKDCSNSAKPAAIRAGRSKTHFHLPATEFRPSDPKNVVPRKTEGAGNAGRMARPQPCVQMKKAHKQVTAGSPDTFRHSPREWF